MRTTVLPGSPDRVSDKTARLTRVPNVGTFVPKMGSEPATAPLAATLFGKTRRAMLAQFYSHPDEAFYVRQLIRAVRGGLGAVQRELKELTQAGIIQRQVRGHQVYYQANPRCPIYAELRGIVLKTAGVGDVLCGHLAPLAGRIRAAFVYGSVARGEEKEGSDIDLMVIGDVSFGDIVTALGPAQNALGREINPTVYSADEFHKKAAAKHHFVTTVIKGPKLFVLGEERELTRLVKERLAR